MSTPTVHPTDNRTVKSYLGQNQYVTCNLILICNLRYLREGQAPACRVGGVDCVDHVPGVQADAAPVPEWSDHPRVHHRGTLVASLRGHDDDKDYDDHCRLRKIFTHYYQSL